jgi:hypothetical protein
MQNSGINYWHNGVMAQRHNGATAQGHNGTKAQWHNGYEGERGRMGDRETDRHSVEPLRR